MSESQPVSISAPGTPPPAREERARGAIARAAQATGVDFRYLMAQAKLESGLDPTARAATSSATGLFQFTQGTWLNTLDRHGARHGLSWAQDAIEGGRIADPGLRANVLSLRNDPDAAALMAAELAGDNAADLTATLGRAPDAAELYLAHFLGSAGAQQFLSALATDPSQSAAAILPKAASANRPIFFSGAAPRSVGAVMDLLRARVNAAMEGGDMPFPAGQPANWALPGGNALPPLAASQADALGPVGREFQAARAAMPVAASLSMSETLQGTFGAAQGGSAPAHVRAAYAKLARFGL